MDCPECSAPKAYMGFSKILCINPQCKYFDFEYWAEMAETNLSDPIPDEGSGYDHSTANNPSAPPSTPSQPPTFYDPCSDPGLFP